MTLRFAPNLSLLWAGLPLADRFERAAAAGFGAVELWWPGDDDALALPGLTERWGLHLALLNFDAGDMPGGDRGLAADPGRVAQLRANVPLALRIAQECGCSRLNLLAGLRDERYPLAEQLRLARDNVRGPPTRRRGRAARSWSKWSFSGKTDPTCSRRSAAAAGFVREVARENVRLQYDAYHMQRMEGDLTTTLDTYWELISHIQVADVPGRGEPAPVSSTYPVPVRSPGRQGLRRLDRAGVPAVHRSPRGLFGWLELLGLPAATGRRGPGHERACERIGKYSASANADSERQRGVLMSEGLGTIGFVGLGVMGLPMAANLLAAGADLVVYNRTRPARDELAAQGAASAGSPAEVVSKADLIIAMLPDDAAVRDVVRDELLPAARPGTLIVDMSTVSPELSRELAADAASRGARMLDAPVSGGDVGAREGTLSIMVGGEAADLERARPALEVLGGSIVHCGPAGAGRGGQGLQPDGRGDHHRRDQRGPRARHQAGRRPADHP